MDSPVLYADVDHDWATLRGPAGQKDLTAGSYAELRKQVVRAANDLARTEQTSVRLVIHDAAQGQHVRLVVDPDGTLSEDLEATTVRPAGSILKEYLPAPGPVAEPVPAVGTSNEGWASQSQPVVQEFSPEAVTASPAYRAPQPSAAVPLLRHLAERRVVADTTPDVPAPAIQPPSRQVPPVSPSNSPVPGEELLVAGRRSFVDHGPAQMPAAEGWRGFAAKVGMRVQPSPAELEHREHVRLVSQHWYGTRTLTVANGKGGVGKTTTTAVLASIFARFGGGGVLAWDNNDTRGTLPWRTETGTHAATIRDMLAAAPALLGAQARDADFAGFVHHQTADKYDVLRSNPELLAADQQISTADFDTLFQVASRFRRIVVFDSGNDESTPRWLRMIDHSYQLVIPMQSSVEHAESGALLLEALAQRDEHSAALAQHAVVIVSQARGDSPVEAQRISLEFEQLGVTAVTVPFDDSLRSGQIRFDALSAKSQRAWVTAAAAVARGFGGGA